MYEMRQCLRAVSRMFQNLSKVINIPKQFFKIYAQRFACACDPGLFVWQQWVSTARRWKIVIKTRSLSSECIILSNILDMEHVQIVGKFSEHYQHESQNADWNLRSRTCRHIRPAFLRCDTLLDSKVQRIRGKPVHQLSGICRARVPSVCAAGFSDLPNCTLFFYLC